MSSQVSFPFRLPPSLFFLSLSLIYTHIRAVSLLPCDMSAMAAAVAAGAAAHPQLSGMVYEYGTAGFRTKADTLEPVLFRVGLLAALRSKETSSGAHLPRSHAPPPPSSSFFSRKKV